MVVCQCLVDEPASQMQKEAMAAASRRVGYGDLEAEGMVRLIFGKKDLVKISAQISEKRYIELQYVAKRGFPCWTVRNGAGIYRQQIVSYYYTISTNCPITTL